MQASDPPTRSPSLLAPSRRFQRFPPLTHPTYSPLPACIHPLNPYKALHCEMPRRWVCYRVKFELLDKIESISDTRIVATKSVSMAEEYLADHFPSFPVLPGVMMLEALTQAAGWLMHHRSKFAKTFAVLKEARQLRYGTFLAPGNTLRVEVDFVKETPTGATFKAAGTVNGEQALTGRLEIAYFNLVEKDPDAAHLDKQLSAHTLSRWQVLTDRSLEVPAASLTL